MYIRPDEIGKHFIGKPLLYVESLPTVIQHIFLNLIGFYKIDNLIPADADELCFG